MHESEFDAALARVFRNAGSRPSDDAVRAVLTMRATRRRSLAPRVLAIAALVCAAAVAATVPGTRAAVADGFGAVADFIHGDGSTPGPSIAKVSHPGWVNDLPEGRSNGPAPPNAHVLATAANGERLLAYRDSTEGSRVCFLYGSFGGECRTSADPIWRRLLSTQPIGLLARSSDEHGVVAVWGLVSGDAPRIRVHRTDGSTRVFAARYGFIMSGPPGNPPVKIDALDDGGAVLGTASADDPMLTRCNPSSGCGAVMHAQE